MVIWFICEIRSTVSHTSWSFGSLDADFASRSTILWNFFALHLERKRDINDPQNQNISAKISNEEISQYWEISHGKNIFTTIKTSERRRRIAKFVRRKKKNLLKSVNIVNYIKWINADENRYSYITDII